MIDRYSQSDAVYTVFRDAYYASIVSEKIEGLVHQEDTANMFVSLINTLQTFKKNFYLIMEYWFKYDLQKDSSWAINPNSIYRKQKEWYLDFEDSRVGMRVLRQIFFKIIEDDIQLCPYENIAQDDFFQTFLALIVETDGAIAEHLGSSELALFNYKFSRIFRPASFNPSYVSRFSDNVQVEPIIACRSLALHMMLLIRHTRILSWIVGQYDIDIASKIAAFAKEFDKNLNQYPKADYFNVVLEDDGLTNINCVFVKKSMNVCKKNILLMMYQIMVGCDLVAGYVSKDNQYDQDNGAKILFLSWKDNVSRIYEMFAALEFNTLVFEKPQKQKIDNASNENYFDELQT